jgi:hypothetical protein
MLTTGRMAGLPAWYKRALAEKGKAGGGTFKTLPRLITMEIPFRQVCLCPKQVSSTALVRAKGSFG